MEDACQEIVKFRGLLLQIFHGVLFLKSSKHLELEEIKGVDWKRSGFCQSLTHQVKILPVQILGELVSSETKHLELKFPNHPLSWRLGTNLRSYEGKDLTRGASTYYSNSSKKPGKSPWVWLNLHFEGRGTCVNQFGI